VAEHYLLAQCRNLQWREDLTRLFLCGDVMTGRGVDQVLACPCKPGLHEGYKTSAIDYVQLAEAANGQIPRGVGPSYVWAAALEEFDRMRPDARIVNLETSITRSEDYEPKGINYRMSPENADCLKAAAIDCCVLGNNHVLDWGPRGLLDTLAALEHLGIKTAGAGRSPTQAGMPATLEIAGKGRVLVFSFASLTSGVPQGWAATETHPGVNLLPDISEATALRIADGIARVRKANDIIVVSVHWGSNWGYGITGPQRTFARALVEAAGVSIVHGHSSHHPKAIEVFRDRLILYGCGDFLNDYEGISGYEKYRDDLVVMYFVDVEPAGNVCALQLVPLQIRKFQLVRPSDQDVRWMQRRLDRECRKFGAGIEAISNGRLALSWKAAAQTG
jgi:poly-gamma-glutamate capsule biosynthesis protein CapA/YwtB (metallophosphatase superfamily)